jgi:lipopolysaccharide/colanic/teichoic acid biosynthesis glycosyltransferase
MAGFAALVLALSKVHAAYVADPPYDFTSSSRFTWAIAYTVLHVVAAYGVGLPELPRSPRAALLSALAASGLAALGVSVVQLALGDALLPRFVVFGAAAGSLPIHVGASLVAQRGRTRQEDRDRVVLVGPADDAERLRLDLGLQPERNAVLVGVLEPAAAAPADPTSKPLVDLVLAERATVVVIDRVAQADDEVVAQAAVLHESGLRVRTLLQFYEEWLGKLPVSELERASLFFDVGEVHRARYGRARRVLDVVLALAGLVPLLVVVPVVAVANLFGNRGPLLYRQQRVGKGGTTFDILKLRTMRPTAPGVLANEWTTEDDPRITPVGRFLRVTHVDELPQVINILRGELSVVGPRPEQPHYVSELSAKLPFYGMRHLVRPGLTGWSQVKYGYAGDEHDALEKLQYEFFYLRHQGLAFDLKVIGRTIRSVAGSQGRGR